jgi:hypothetical protein
VISGQTRAVSEPYDPARKVADFALFIPRKTIEALFITTTIAAGLVENEQFVPKLKETFFTQNGQVGIIPTAFLETGFNPNIGARLVASADHMATTLRAGYGGPDMNLVESRLRFSYFSSVPVVLSFEGLHDRQTGLAFLGLGPNPQSDSRNHFNPDTDLRSGVYRQMRDRLIVSLGMRPAGDTEILLSTSYTRRKINDAPDSGTSALSQVFLPESLPVEDRAYRKLYAETAIRIDTRESRGRPVGGTLIESYAGIARGVLPNDPHAIQAGSRGALFIPIYRQSNILSPRLAIDTISSVGKTPLPFTDYLSPSDFRGIDGRRDNITAVASLDYRWTLMKFVAARVFTDVSTVAPRLDALRLDSLHYAWGFGLDLHSAHAELGRILFAFSPEGFRFAFNIGVAPSGFGDRQHRN